MEFEIQDWGLSVDIDMSEFDSELINLRDMLRASLKVMRHPLLDPSHPDWKNFMKQRDEVVNQIEEYLALELGDL